MAMPTPCRLLLLIQKLLVGIQPHPELPFPDNRTLALAMYGRILRQPCSAPGKTEASPCVSGTAAPLSASLTVPGGVQLCLPGTSAGCQAPPPLGWVIWSQTLTHTGLCDPGSGKQRARKPCQPTDLENTASILFIYACV